MLIGKRLSVISFVFVLVLLLPSQLFGLSITDELTEQILRLQLLESSYLTLEQKSKEQELQLSQLNLLNQQLQENLDTTEENCTQLSKDCKSLQRKSEILRTLLVIITPVAILGTTYIVIDLTRDNKPP